MAAWAAPVSTPESKLAAFVTFSVDKLDVAKDSLEDEGAEKNYQETCDWACGLSKHMKSVGSAASAELKASLRAGLLEAWDIGKEKPGAGLRAGGVPLLRARLLSLVEEGGCLAAAHHAMEVAHAAEAEHHVAHAAAVAGGGGHGDATKPAALKDMPLDKALVYMWETLDKPNRMEWGEGGFTLDLQSKGAYDATRDTCSRPLFSTCNPAHPFWKSRVTKAFVSLLDNYERTTGVAEKVTKEEKSEMTEFIDALGHCDVIKFAYNWLKLHGKDPRCKKWRSLHDFELTLFDLWLATYRRVVDNDSSGFEHVFVGEEKGGKIMGLHNWVQYYLEEKKGAINYLGWKGKQDADYSDDVNIVSVMFAWADDDPDVEVKPLSTFLCGSTVEWEMAALTMAFLGGNQEGDNPFHMGGENMMIKCFPQHVRGGATKIGTAYLEVA